MTFFKNLVLTKLVFQTSLCILYPSDGFIMIQCMSDLIE